MERAVAPMARTPVERAGVNIDEDGGGGGHGDVVAVLRSGGGHGGDHGHDRRWDVVGPGLCSDREHGTR